jgi:hypothetical protein
LYSSQYKKRIDAIATTRGRLRANSINQEQLVTALKPEDWETMQINATLTWIEEAEVPVFEAKEKELEGKLMPMLTAASQASGAEAGGLPQGAGGFHGGGAGGFTGGIDCGGGAPSPGGVGRGDEPRVEDVD